MTTIYCPTPYKDSYPNRGAARKVMRDMRSRARRSKRKYSPVEPYDCYCGGVHLTTKR